MHSRKAFEGAERIGRRHGLEVRRISGECRAPARRQIHPWRPARMRRVHPPPAWLVFLGRVCLLSKLGVRSREADVADDEILLAGSPTGVTAGIARASCVSHAQKVAWETRWRLRGPKWGMALRVRAERGKSRRIDLSAACLAW